MEEELLASDRGKRREKRERSKSSSPDKKPQTTKGRGRPHIKNKDLVRQRKKSAAQTKGKSKGKPKGKPKAKTKDKSKSESKNKSKEKGKISPYPSAQRKPSTPHKKKKEISQKIKNLKDQLNLYKGRLQEELEIGIVLNKIKPIMKDYELDKHLISFMKEVTVNSKVSSKLVITPFMVICQNYITQNRGSQSELWDSCRDYLKEKLANFEDLGFDATPIKKPFLSPSEIIEKLDKDWPLKYCVDRRFYGAKKSDLETLELQYLDTYYEEDFYCNEIIVKMEDDIRDRLYEQQRVNYGEIISCITELCLDIHRSIKANRVFHLKIQNGIEKLKEADKQRVKIQQKMEIKEYTHKKFDLKSNERVRNLADFVEHIKQADLLDLQYLADIIQEEKRKQEEIIKNHPPLSKYLSRKKEDKILITKPGYSSPMTLADHAQSLEHNLLPKALNILQDKASYISHLLALKRSHPFPPRKRHSLKIWIVEHNIGYLYRNIKDIEVRNGRNPFQKYSDIDYEEEDFETVCDFLDVGVDEIEEGEERIGEPTPQRVKVHNKRLEKLEQGPVIVSFWVVIF